MEMQERRTMTKADIIETVYEKVGGFSKKEAAEIVETVFDTIKETLEKGEKIKISGFGNFVVRDKNARVGRNPQTGEEITISARRVLTFKPSQVLKNALNS
jgi:integration host factor subunit alpha